jgi:hypothetical protein
MHSATAVACALCGNLLNSGSGSAARAASPSSSTARAISAPEPADARFAALRKLIPSAPSSAHESRAGSAATHTRVAVAAHTRVAVAARELLAPSRIAADADGVDLEPWTYLTIGLATAPIFAWTPILQYMGWFLASLVHEMGHAAFAWLCGMPAVPAISLAGHAAAVHSEQSYFLAVLVLLGLGAGAWHVFTGRVRWIALALIAVIYPAIAFTGAKDFFHLIAGHGAELLFAALCLWKTLDGGFTESRTERGLYGTVGWYLLGKNLSLCFGLMRSADARAEYNDNGSFGLTNDYIRVAEDVLGCPLERVALMMLVAGLFVLPAAMLGWRLSRAMRRAGA